LNTEVLPTRTAGELAVAVERAVRELRAGQAVAVPTETVYGLAADALNPKAVARIFEAKERPRFDPLIVHLPDRSWLPRLSSLSADCQPLVDALTERFWPGPLTLVLPRRELVPDIVTSGLETVAVRISGHPVLSEILRVLDRPVAAPSANRFGRISPTAASHVLEELAGRIPLIVDGSAAAHGLESTIVAIRGGGRMQLLRRGPVTTEQLSEFGAVVVAPPDGAIEAPGQLPSHYAPRARLVICDNWRNVAVDRSRCALLSWRGIPDGVEFAATRVLSPRGDLREAAANLFRCLRELDASGVDQIIAELVPDEGIGSAIMDRLRRAAA
jgi:L-threonylcarbamoyladenylate synthase